MSDDPTNLKIAQLLKLQTYDERMEVAKWFQDVTADAIDGNMTSDGKPDDDLFAFWFGSWADQEIASYEDDEPTP